MPALIRAHCQTQFSVLQSKETASKQFGCDVETILFSIILSQELHVPFLSILLQENVSVK